jgi:pimeloyl-ACP methyl ester carboxylesterase
LQFTTDSRGGKGYTVRLTLLFAVVALVLSALAPSFGVAAQTDGEATPGAEIRGTFDIGDRSLYLECAGSGSPTVVLEHGQGGSRLDLASLQRALENDALVCIYDHAGQGQSDPAPLPRTAADVVADLHALLAAASVPGPYVLIGQSAGGVFVQLYSRTYPHEVAGVVAMNPVPPAGLWLEKALPLMTEQERADEEAYYRGDVDGEAFDWYASFTELEAATDPPDVPFLVLISTIAQCESPDDVCGRTYGVYETVMRELAESWSQGKFLQLEASHEIYGHRDTIAAIRRVVEAARDPNSWATPMAGTPAA